jgi:nicotinate phosphoribosyltransferase
MKDEPIIESRLDIDYYKFTMGQMIFHRHPKVPATSEFINRTTSVPLADIIDIGRLREELEHCRTLRFTPQELYYLRYIHECERLVFKPDYINFLREATLPAFDLAKENGQFKMAFSCNWSEQTYWETLAMSITNELYYRALMKDYSRFEREMIEARGRLALSEKIQELRTHPEINFSDFGTRRRFGRKWQDYVVGVLAEELPEQFKGTSNVFLAKKHGLMPIGTNAHELPMAYSGIYRVQDEKIDSTYSQQQVLKDWENEYGLGLSIFLPDTFGSDWFFLNVASPDQLRRWKGSRQDSGIPLVYAENRIREYEEAGINPLEKIIIFADGLNVEKMIEISGSLRGLILYTFGWGTDLTNDVGFNSLSIVVKVTKAAGYPVAKLSDNIAKATGSKEAVERMKKAVGYTNDFSEQCKC